MFRFTRKTENIHDLAAASSSRNIATGALLDTSTSDNNFSIQSANKRRRWNQGICKYQNQLRVVCDLWNSIAVIVNDVGTSSNTVWLLILSIFLGGGVGRSFMGNSFFSWKNETKINIEILFSPHKAETSTHTYLRKEIDEITKSA